MCNILFNCLLLLIDQLVSIWGWKEDVVILEWYYIEMIRKAKRWGDNEGGAFKICCNVKLYFINENEENFN